MPLVFPHVKLVLSLWVSEEYITLVYISHRGFTIKEISIMSIHIRGLNTPKSLKNIFPHIKGSMGVLILHSNINIGGYFIWVRCVITFKSWDGFIYIAYS